MKCIVENGNLNYECNITLLSRSSSIELQSNDDKSAEVMSVVLQKKDFIGINICKHKILKDFFCVQSFVNSPDGRKSELETDGRVAVGDLLVAVNSINLVKLSHTQIKEIILNSQLFDDHTILTFIRPNIAQLHSKDVESAIPARNCDMEDENEDNQVEYLDPPKGTHFFQHYI